MLINKRLWGLSRISPQGEREVIVNNTIEPTGQSNYTSKQKKKIATLQYKFEFSVYFVPNYNYNTD